MPDAQAFAASFGAALLGTAKVFAMGAAGYAFLRRGWISSTGLQTLGQLVGLLTLPCLIFYRIATRFDPQALPDWPKFALAGSLVTVVGLSLGKLLARRHADNDEVTMLVGYQNAGFFVLPLLQALLPTREYERASLLLFIVVIPFNATLWFAGSWFLLKQKTFALRVLLTPTLVSTLVSLLLYGAFHDFMHRFDNTFVSQVLFGTQTNRSGAVQLLGDLTVPLATFALGGSIAVTQAEAGNSNTRAAWEVAGAKLVLMPLFGLLLTPLVLRWLNSSGDYATALLFALQWAAPPASALPVFAGQHNYRMTLIPLACLVSYALCLLTVPFWVALVPR